MAKEKENKEKGNNLLLWDKVEKTNPNYTKKANIGGHNITTIAPQYQIKQATEQFGPYGEGWGFKDIELGYELAEKFNLVVFKGVFFFPGGQFEIVNSCKMFMDRAKKMVDDNFAKKIETDSLTKALSKLGFNADIFLGKFEDERYMDELNEEFPLPAAPVVPPTEFEIALDEFKNAGNIAELQSLWKKHKKYQNQPLIIAAKNEVRDKISTEIDEKYKKKRDEQ